MPRPAAHYRIKLRGPVYQVRFTRNGKEHRLSANTGEQGAARQEAARLVREHDAKPSCAVCGGKPKSGGDTAKLAEEFLKAVRRSHGEAYAKRAATDLNQYIIDRWPDPSAITSKSWEEAKLALHEEETARRERLSWGSIANLANTLRAFLRYCAGVGATESVPELRNPTAKLLAADRAYLRPLDADEKQALLWALALAGESRALRVYIALFETWMRKGELAAMTPRWVDFRQETIHIPARHSKNGYDREIDLTPRAAEAIREQMEQNEADAAEARKARPTPAGHVRDILSGEGDAGQHIAALLAQDQEDNVVSLQRKRAEQDTAIFGPFIYRSLFARTCELAGIDPKGLTAHHVTRRTAATLAGAKPGASLAALKSQGGWRSSAVVDTYMRASVDAARKVTR